MNTLDVLEWCYCAHMSQAQTIDLLRAAMRGEAEQAIAARTERANAVTVRPPAMAGKGRVV